VVGSYEQGNELSASIKCREFLIAEQVLASQGLFSKELVTW